MLGIADVWVATAYVLCILSTILCVVYGAITWNRGNGGVATDEDVAWAREEERIEEEL